MTLHALAYIASSLSLWLRTFAVACWDAALREPVDYVSA